MIILIPVNNKIKIHVLENKKTINSKEKPEIQGNFILQKEENKIKIQDITLEKDSKTFTTTNDELLKILKKQNIIITNEDKILIHFLRLEAIKYKIQEICENCQKMVT